MTDRLAAMRRGQDVWLSHEATGLVIDGLVLVIAEAKARGAVNPESSSATRIAWAEEVIQTLSVLAPRSVETAGLREAAQDILTSFARRPGWVLEHDSEEADALREALAASRSVETPRAIPPEGTRLVLVAEDLLGQFGTRTDSGYAITVEWGEQRLEGWYEPTFTVHYDQPLAALSPDTETCEGSCGSLGWTRERYGRLTHKHSCPRRVDTFCQSHDSCVAAALPLRALKDRGWLKHSNGCSWESRADDGTKTCNCGLLAALSDTTETPA